MNNHVCIHKRSLHKLCCGITGPHGSKGNNGNNGNQGPTGPTGPSNQTPDISFSVDKSGSQTIPATPLSFTYITIAPWAPLGIGQYNTGSLNEPNGQFAAPIQGKYHFIGAVHCISVPDIGAILSLRLVHITTGIQLAETRINAGAIFDQNSGICMNLSHELLLNVGDIVALQLSYLTQGPAVGMLISPTLGITRFTGYLLRETVGDSV